MKMTKEKFAAENAEYQLLTSTEWGQAVLASLWPSEKEMLAFIYAQSKPCSTAERLRECAMFPIHPHLRYIQAYQN